MDQMLKGAGFVLILFSVFFIGNAVVSMEKALKLYEKASLVEEIRVDRAYLQFLYQVCRDQRYEANEDRSECYGVVLEQENKKAINIKTLEN